MIGAITYTYFALDTYDNRYSIRLYNSYYRFQKWFQSKRILKTIYDLVFRPFLSNYLLLE